MKQFPRSPSGTQLPSAVKANTRTRQKATGQFVKEERILADDLKVKVDESVLGTMEVRATDYNALLSSQSCLEHLAEHAGQSVSQWKATLGSGATDYPLMAQDAYPHIERLKTLMYSLAQAPVITNTSHAVIDVDQPKTSSSRAELTAVDPQEMLKGNV